MNYRENAKDEYRPFWRAEGPFVVDESRSHRYRASCIEQTHVIARSLGKLNDENKNLVLKREDNFFTVKDVLRIHTANEKVWEFYGERAINDFHQAFIEALNYELAMMRGTANDSANEKLKEFAKDCRDNWDCDEDAHKYGTSCRACEAEKIIGPKH